MLSKFCLLLVSGSRFRTLISNDVKTEGLLSDFAVQLHRRNAGVPYKYFTLLEISSVSPTLVLNQNAKTKKR